MGHPTVILPGGDGAPAGMGRRGICSSAGRGSAGPSQQPHPRSPANLGKQQEPSQAIITISKPAANTHTPCNGQRAPCHATLLVLFFLYFYLTAGVITTIKETKSFSAPFLTCSFSGETRSSCFCVHTATFLLLGSHSIPRQAQGGRRHLGRYN